MSFLDCIQTAADTGKISQEKLEEAQEAYVSASNDLQAKGASEDEADQAAGMQALKKLTSEKADKRWAMLKQLEKTHDIVARFVGNANPIKELKKLPDELLTGYESNMGVMGSFISKLISEFEPKNGGLTVPLQNEMELIKGAYGDSVTEHVQDLLKGVEGSWDWTHDRMKAEGAIIPDNPNYRWPQQQDRLKVRQVEKEEFVKDHLASADWDVMRWGGKEIPEEFKEEALGHMYDSIITNGAPKYENLAQNTNGSLGTRLARERFMYYKDSQSWIGMNQKYGRGGAYAQLMGHMEVMAKDLSILRQFGPNVDPVKQTMLNAVHHQVGELEKALPVGSRKGQSLESKRGEAVKEFNRAYDIFTHQLVNGEENIMSQVAGGIRGAVLVAHLPTAVFSAVTGDPMLAKFAGDLNGLQSVGSFSNYLAELGKGKAGREQALRDGTMLEASINMANVNLRYGMIDTPVWTRRLGDVIMRSGGALIHHSALKAANAAGMMFDLAREAHLPFEETSFKQGMEAHGIEKEDWDKLRATPVVQSENGANLLRPLDYQLAAKSDSDIKSANKFSDWLTDVTNYSNPRPGLRTRVTLGHDIPVTTGLGQITRAMGMLQSFPVEIWHNQLAQILRVADPRQRYAYAAKFALLMTLGGMMREQLGNIYRGNDPENMATPGFIGRAALAGGAGTIVADLVADLFDTDRATPATVQTLTGIAKGLKDAASPIVPGAKDTSARLPDDIFNTAGGLTPAPWEVKFLWRATLQDELMQMTDPAGYSRLQASRMKLAQQDGQGNWMADGRAPNFGNAVGQ